jgi:2-phosphoglycerate kinase
MSYPKVIYLGGAPMLGKTTTARMLASRLVYCCIPADDIGVAIGTVVPRDGPTIDYREHYIANSAQTLIDDLNRGHERQWPTLRAIIEKHAT